MTWESLVAALLALVSGGATGSLLRGRHERIHGLIVKDLDLYQTLPEASSVKTRLLEDIDVRVGSLLDARREERRHVPAVAAGVMFLCAALGAAFAALATSASWWLDLLLWVVVALSAPIAAFGFYDGLRKRRRNDRGQVIET